MRAEALRLLDRARVLYRALRDELHGAGVHVMDYAELDDAQREAADAYFATNVFPVLTPLAFDPARPFPHISNLSLNLAVLVRTHDGEDRFARVKIPRTLPRLVPVCPPDGAGPICERSEGQTPRAAPTTSCGSSSWSPRTWTRSSRASTSSRRTRSASRATPR